MHCRRKTIGEANTIHKIEELIIECLPLTDGLGYPLLKMDETLEIWKQEKKHVKCLQDIPDIPIYTIQNYVQKSSNGSKVPVYRCARGTTSLESFHMHLNRFIPGFAANAVNFQAYLIEGLFRWNSMGTPAAKQNSDPVISFHAELKSFVIYWGNNCSKMIIIPSKMYNYLQNIQKSSLNLNFSINKMEIILQTLTILTSRLKTPSISLMNMQKPM